MKNETVEIQFDEITGKLAIAFANATTLKDLTSVIELADGTSVATTDLPVHHLTSESYQDTFGVGKCYRFTHTDDTQHLQLTQEVIVYDNQVVTMQLVARSEEELKSNHLDVFIMDEELVVKQQTDVRFLAVPFDNDKWAKFVDYPIEYAPMSYEFTAIHLANQQTGLVIGSVEHDTWKTGITSQPLTVTAGVATELTRDLNGAVHGYVTHQKIQSPRIFIGFYEDFQAGFLEFGRLNAAIKPALPWEGDVPLGWNSWAALMGTLTKDKYLEASQYMKERQPVFTDASGKQFINFDAGWNKFTNQMKHVVPQIEANHQLAGTYLAPFIGISPFKGEVAPTDGDYEFKDLLLKDHNGEVLPQVDGLYSYDPTHPGTLAQLKYNIERIKKWGFKSIKIDFLGHACREGKFYNPEITTGIQAYNFAMNYLLECIGDSGIFLSLSIDPIFPHGYGHGRRISCDAFGSIDQSEYVNNSTTYLWWMNDLLYRYNDPDHLVLYKSYDMNSISFEEAKTRFNSGVICGGMMINSDDYHYEVARERGEILFGNEEINQIIREGITFKPVPTYTGEQAASAFLRRSGEGWLLALFNYSLSDAQTVDIDLSDLLGVAFDDVEIKDLWSKEEWHVSQQLQVTLPPTGSTILRIN